MLDAARELWPLVCAAADQIEADRQLSRPVVDAFARAGLFRMLVPRVLGGGEIDPETYVRILEEVSIAHGSAGWCLLAGSFMGITGGFLPEDVARLVFVQDPGANVGAIISPSGRAVAVDGGYRATGRWAFASGIMHATWQGYWCVVYDGDEPRLDPSGAPETILAYFPRKDIQIVDTWNVTGLRGTGSHDITVADVFVPESLTMPGDIRNWIPRQPGPLYSSGIPLEPLAVVAVLLGIARHAIDTVVELAAAARGRRSSKRPRCHSCAAGSRPDVGSRGLVGNLDQYRTRSLLSRRSHHSAAPVGETPLLARMLGHVSRYWLKCRFTTSSFSTRPRPGPVGGVM